MLKHVLSGRRTRGAVALMALLGVVVLYVSSGYVGEALAQRDAMRPSRASLLRLEETIQSIRLVQRNVKAKPQVGGSSRFDQDGNEIFIRVRPDGGTENFVFGTKKPMSMQERLMRSTTTLGPPKRTSNSASRSRGSTTDPSRNAGQDGNNVLTTRPRARVQMTSTPTNTSETGHQRGTPVVVGPAQQSAKKSQYVRVGVTVDQVPRPRVTDVSCAKLFDNDPAEQSKSQTVQRQKLKVPIPDEEYSKLTRDCEKFKRERQYILNAVSPAEADFPIAYSMVVFKDVEQVERLLRAIYRPQNYYCVHVDTKASKQVRQSIESLAACFDNVFLSSRSVDVQWGFFSVLEPELICMEDLVKYRKWKYFINLTGQEWPLKTNEDIVKILKAFNGANSMEGTVKRRNVERTQFVHNGFSSTEQRMREAPPAGVRLTKGSVHIAAARAFVEFVLSNSVALKFRDWLHDTGIPDETFFSSLNHSPNLNVPGAYKGEPETDPAKYPFIARFKNWGTQPFDYPCKGQRVRQICIWSAADLPLLKTRPELFTNKFYLDYEPLALDCMEELHYNRTREEISGDRKFSTLYYQRLSFVRNHVP